MKCDWCKEDNWESIWWDGQKYMCKDCFNIFEKLGIVEEK
jgi:hypothetical protein